MSRRNLPRHGDPIVTPEADVLGGIKYPASAQFQRFLDELALLTDSLATVDLNDLLQEVEADKASFVSSIAKLFAISAGLDDKMQEIYVIKSVLESARINLNGVIELSQDLAQETAQINIISKQSEAKLRALEARFDDLEQIVHGD